MTSPLSPALWFNRCNMLCNLSKEMNCIYFQIFWLYIFFFPLMGSFIC